MSNVATIDPRPNLVTGNRPSAIVPTDMDSAYRLAKAVCLAGMAPKGMETPEKCMIAIMRGLEVGLTPFMALDKIAIVNGRPVIWGDGAMGLVRGSGLCEFVKERIEGKNDDRVAVCESKRRGEAEPIQRTFSVMDAKKAGLWGKAGPWQQYPERMLQMRARAFCLRDGFADVLGGLYIREEVEDAKPPREIDHSDEPPAPPQIVAPAVAPVVPPVPETTAAEVVPDPEHDNAKFLEFVASKFAGAEDGDQLNAAWDRYVTPAESKLFPLDQEDLMSAFRKREHELS